MSSQDYKNDTIAAIATPPGEGGIGILRLSGPAAPSVLGKVWKGNLSVQKFKSHRLYYGKICDPRTDAEIDEGLVVWMRAPRSYTGEEVVEIHGHGGPILLNKILELLFDLGLRLAEPGEFTRRAFLNGKLDLLQAEAVGELIHAKSEAAYRNARAQLEGRLSQEVGRVRDRLIFLLAQVEAAIDFPEEDIEILDLLQIRREIDFIIHTLKEWLEKFRWGRLLREGARLALVGRPNVGKSSLLNLLLGEDRAIVHPSPGTTRDVLEGWVEWEGVGFQVFDTAGIRSTKGEVEKEGIRRSLQVANQADLTLWLLDISEPLREEDRQIAETLPRRTLVVGNKADLAPVLQGFPPGWGGPSDLWKKEWLLISAKTGEGLSRLKEEILREVGWRTLSEKGNSFLNNARHRESLCATLRALERSQEALTQGLPPELVAADLREGSQALGCLLGDISHEEVLDRIFSEFCLGK